MIGRGDLGVEVPFAELPAIQKYLITKCRLLGKRVITATEMLESMIHNPRPTRAEISDVANAVYDGTSAVMLSGESAAGKYPVKTVQTMAEIVEETEKHIDYETLFRKEEFQIKNMVDAISHATCCMACDIGAKTIVVSSLSGASLAVAVVEPTPSGRHDFERVAALCDHFRIPVAVLINKADLNHEEVQAITRLADDKGYTVVGALPFDPAVTGAMIRRKALTETDSPLASTLSAIWGRIRELAYAPRKRG